MNLWALEYIIEVAKTGSVSKASQKLYLSQPHLSNTIKAMEAELGVKLFVHSTRGMCLTDEGRDFVQRAQSILDEVKDMEDMFAVKPEDCVRLRISVTRSYQIHRCVMDFVNSYSHKPQFRVSVKETNPFEVLEDVHTREAEMGVLHCFGAQEAYFLNRFKTYSLQYKKHYEKEFLLAMSANNPLASRAHITKDMLEDQLLVMYGDYEIPSASYKVVMEENGIVMPPRRFYVYDRGGAMETLGQCDNAVMWITSLHPDTLRKEGIVLRRCEDVNVRDMGYSIYPSEEGISPAARELYEKMQQVDWMMTDREDYFASQRPEAPQGSTSPLVVTGRPIS